jgi:multiple sugar transport system permease protein
VKRTPAIVLLYAVLIVGAFFTLLPFIWMLTTSFKDPVEALVMPPQWIPRPFHRQTYVNAWDAALSSTASSWP